MARKLKYTQKRPQHNTGQQLSGKVVRLLKATPDKTFTPKMVAKQFGYRGDNGLEKIKECLLHLAQKGELSQVDAMVFKSKVREEKLLTGTIDHVNPRFAYLTDAGTPEDIKIFAEDLKGAMHKDVVRVAVRQSREVGGRSKRGNDQRQRGRVIEVVHRHNQQIVGIVDQRSRHTFVAPDSKKLHQDIFIPPNADLLGAQHEDKVLVNVTRWPSGRHKAEGKIAEVLGPAGKHEVEMHSIMLAYDLPTRFPKKVEQEAADISTSIPPEEIKRRKDFRKTCTFTIDPVDAKDFDDALSIRNLSNGHFEVGIHIADVTHYVEPYTELEKEAFERATSVYLVDRVVPMLPEKLSNELCSLRPHEDKLCFSAVFEIDLQGRVQQEWFGRTVIHSDHRFTYEAAQEVLDGKASGPYAQELKTLNKLAYALRNKRFKEGSIAFEMPEVKFKLDENGTPLAVIPKERVDTHKLVEDFMLLANKKVAEWVAKKTKTFVYRVHEDPDFEKLNNFANFAKRFGHQLSFSEDDLTGVAPTINTLSANILGKPEEPILQGLAVRAMAKARYTTETLGHFGLGFQHYTHFTSPIRRYPDMMVHRLLATYLENPKEKVDRELYESQCQHASAQEKQATDAERESIKYKQVEFIANTEERVFDGIVSGVADFGLFVELSDTKCEGMVRLSSIEDDEYDYIPERYEIVGRHNKRSIAFGDRVQVEVLGTSLRNRTIDLQLIKKLD